MTQPTKYEPTAEQIFRFDVGHDGDHVVVELWGDLDISNALRLREAFIALDDLAGYADVDAAAVVVDLSGVQFIDSSCLAILLAASKRVRASGRAFVLRAPARSVVFALAASGLIRKFSYDTETLNSTELWPTRLPPPVSPRRWSPQVIQTSARPRSTSATSGRQPQL